MILQPVAGLIPEEEIALQLVFHDEAQHAALAWRTIHWALLAEDGNVEKLLQTALENLKLRRLERRKHSFCKVTFNYVIIYIGIYFYMIYIYIYI